MVCLNYTSGPHRRNGAARRVGWLRECPSGTEALQGPFGGMGRLDTMPSRLGGCMRRRTFVAGLAGAAVWPRLACAQQALPVVGFLASQSGGPASAGRVAG